MRRLVDCVKGTGSGYASRQLGHLPKSESTPQPPLGLARFEESRVALRTCAAGRNERGERFWHRSLVVAYENSGLSRRLAQDGFILKTIQSSGLPSLKIDAGFAA